MEREELFKINEKKNQITITLDKEMYNIDAIYTASYIFLEKAYILLKSDENNIYAILQVKEKGLDLEEVANEFCNQLINYSFQLEMSKKNLDVKRNILEQIYSSTPEDFNDNNEEIDDPDGILIPWEDKYGKEN